LCEEYCCQDQLVLWHIPGSELHKCDDYGEAVASDSDIEGCHKLCVQDVTCLYFSVDEDGTCFHGEFCGGEMKEHAEKLPDNEKNPGGIYQLYCAMSGSVEKTCTGKTSFDQEVGFLTYCFDKCEGSDECRYFTYREHTSRCELFETCAEFEEGSDQSLVYMMHEEAFGKEVNAGAIKAHHHKHGLGKHFDGQELSATAEQATVGTKQASGAATAALGAVGVMVVAFATLLAVRTRRGLAQSSATPMSALTAGDASL